MRRRLSVAVLSLSLLACSAVRALVPGGAGSPTPATAEAVRLSTLPSSTATAAATDTATPLPVLTQAPLPSPTPTSWLPPLSPMPTSPSSLSCMLNWQSPGNYISYNPKDEFTVGWKVTNTGTRTWDPGSVVFTYVSGAKLYDDPLLRLKSSVSPGQSVILSVHMRAPRNSTTYTTHWSLKMGDSYFCPLSLWIYVK